VQNKLDKTQLPVKYKQRMRIAQQIWQLQNTESIALQYILVTLYFILRDARKSRIRNHHEYRDFGQVP